AQRALRPLHLVATPVVTQRSGRLAVPDPVGKKSDGGREVQRPIPAQQYSVIVIDQKTWPRWAARLDQRGVEVRGRQVAAIESANAEPLPRRERLPDIRMVHQCLVEARRQQDLAAPGFVPSPADPGQIVGSRGEYVGFRPP